MEISLVQIGSSETEIPWNQGPVWKTSGRPVQLAQTIHQAIGSQPPEGMLFWDPQLGNPDSQRMSALLRQPADVWHGGLQLGMGGQPGLLDFVQPVWMFNHDPELDNEATSWRISMRACLLRPQVLRRLGTLDPGFQSLEGASLDLGLRCIQNGAILRFTPDLISDPPAEAGHIPIPIPDEVRFIERRFGRKWAAWALARALATGYANRVQLLEALFKIQQPAISSEGRHPAASLNGTPLPTNSTPARVSIIIPTINRYPHLHTLLSQLRSQTHAVHEIIIIDQTAAPLRDETIESAYPELPIKVAYQAHPGQCTSRNTGILNSEGEYLLFLDDDIEAGPTLIEDHLRTIREHQADVSSGLADEVGVVEDDNRLRAPRLSDVLPLGNTMIHRRALSSSGLLDLAYNRGKRADGDLGMRLFSTGSLMILNPNIRVLHHRAPQGGLRSHGERKVTAGSSRRSLTERHLPGPTELYLAKRYFSPRQQRENRWIRLLSTFSHQGSIPQKLLKALLGLVLLPHSLLVLHRNGKKANELFDKFPQIPILSEP